MNNFKPKLTSQPRGCIHFSCSFLESDDLSRGLFWETAFGKMLANFQSIGVEAFDLIMRLNTT
eukprot:2427854-Amphidinium_carterae.1